MPIASNLILQCCFFSFRQNPSSTRGKSIVSYVKDDLRFPLLTQPHVACEIQPFSFGGLYGTKSKYGDMDITGDGAMEFFTNRIKITSKWPLLNPPSSRKRSHGDISTDSQELQTDSANFAGQM